MPGEWGLEIVEPRAVAAASCLQRVDIVGFDGTALHDCIVKAAHGAVSRLAPRSGAMVRAVWFDAGPQAAGRLLLTIHHLSVDGVSWRIIVPDLAAAYGALAAGGAPELLPKGTSLRRWSQRLTAAATDAVRVQEFGFWNAMLSAPSLSLIDGALDRDRDVAGNAGHLTMTLPASVTGALLTRVPAAFYAGINDVLLTGLAVAIAEWRQRRGQRTSNAVLIDVEGHGREEIFSGIELSRTVGWFTSLYPVRLDPGSLDIEEAMAGGPALGRALKLIKEQLHTVPEHGLGFGLLRYLNARHPRRCARCRTHNWALTIWAAWRQGQRPTGALRARRQCWVRAEIRRCSLRIRSRSMRSRLTAATEPHSTPRGHGLRR